MQQKLLQARFPMCRPEQVHVSKGLFSVLLPGPCDDHVVNLKMLRLQKTHAVDSKMVQLTIPRVGFIRATQEARATAVVEWT